MKIILKIAAFVTIIIFVSVALVFAHKISQSQLTSNPEIVKECVTRDNRSCDQQKIAVNFPFIPDQNFDNQQRFLTTIANKIPTVPEIDTFEYTLLRSYGTVFINQESGIKLPEKVILDNELETQSFQDKISIELVNGTEECYLQKPAAAALNKAKDLENIPLKSGYAGDCLRNFATNLRFWNKYANRETLNQVKAGKETKILGLVAPPGTSQHLWGLAIDLQILTPSQKQTLNENGWFQTVVNDLPHWTYLGWREEDLPKFGLQQKIIQGIKYWITPI
ncbi:D-alanyl-D-alanine carboxypeptidase family protein [Dolichospermum planctonicum]|uniref:Peptidase M15B and M15C, D,D-carboxypeptidase VanY/endolysin n=1 Tax=Dolichospermum planctonicum TaxID=136072 RepID=A0A480AHL4_9CYAN|nr:D-alanyl-D-alanine carboxypeptidase family protein [Dolichospermum planctonicum]GCL43223.1 peptidase M15B and M15C, D,D-carboxypeptidase VanY/endolysin [Dolichospermum planctonicum]